MFIVIILIVALVELFFIPLTDVNIVVFLGLLIFLMVLLEILFPRSHRRFRKLSQKRLQELFGIHAVQMGFDYNPEKLEPTQLRLSVDSPEFSEGLQIQLPFSYESNMSGFVDFSYNAELPHGKAMLAGISAPMLRAEFVSKSGKIFPLRGPTAIESPANMKLYTERFFLDRSVSSCSGGKIQGYAVLLNSKTDYAVYRFPSLRISLAKRRILEPTP